MAQPSLIDQLWTGLQNALDDIRHKVVEEPWFGREISGDLAPDHAPDDVSSPLSYEQYLGLDADTPEQDPTSPAPEIGLDHELER